MSREPERYRECLENILSYFNGKRVLTEKEVERYLGKSRTYVNKYIPITKKGITVENLAMTLSKF